LDLERNTDSQANLTHIPLHRILLLVTLLWQELKRRKVTRTITVYAAAAFVIIEVANNISDPLNMPGWISRWIIILLGIGLLIAIFLSWIFDITPEGIVKTTADEEPQAKPETSSTRSWKLATYISVSIIVIFVVYNILSGINRSLNLQKLDKSIAVLPFENWNSDEEYAHMGDAIANEINTQLTKIKEFHIFSYTSSSQYKGPNKPTIPQIGKELGANFIVKGTVERQLEGYFHNQSRYSS
jgi:hypothetical protein